MTGGPTSKEFIAMVMANKYFTKKCGKVELYKLKALHNTDYIELFKVNNKYLTYIKVFNNNDDVTLSVIENGAFTHNIQIAVCSLYR